MRSFFSGLRQFWAVALVLTLLAGSACWAGEMELSPTEQTWLDAHPVIRMSVDANYGPYTFLDAKGHLQGMAMEFFADIERLLGVRFEIISNLSWSQQMQAVRERRLDAVATVVKLPEREVFLEFTEIYLPTPLVIMTRSETPQLHSLKELQQLRLSLVKGFSSSKQLTAQFPGLRPRYVTTSLEGLRLVASGTTDAYVGALGVNSFLAARNGITNLKVNAAFNMVDNGQRFGVRKDWPQLARLLNKALLAISAERRNAIFQRWLPRHTSEIKRLSRPSYVTRLFPWLLGGLGLALLGYLVTLLWNRQLKKELARRGADLERAQAIAHLGDWSMEVKSSRIHWSDELYRIAGRASQSEALDWSVLREWVHQDERERHNRYLQQLSRSRPGDSLPPQIFHLLRPDGDSRWLEITSAVEFDAANQPVRFYGTAQDVTERKQAAEELSKYRDHLEELVEDRTNELKEKTDKIEASRKALTYLVEDVNKAREELEKANEKLKELDQLKSMFIASMSHELRTPLNSIIGFTGIILQGMTGEINAEQKDQLQRVYGSAKHLLNLITDIIDISKIEAGKVEVYAKKVNLNGLIKEAVSTLKPEIDNKGLGLEISLPPDLQLTTDRKRLLQCILNFLSNAVKFTEKGKIEIAAHEVGDTAGLIPRDEGTRDEGMRDEGMRDEGARDERTRDEETSIVSGSEATGRPSSIVISVADTGVGIKKEDIPKLFKSFVRLDTPLKTVIPGTGLGLYLTKKLATEVLKGSVSVESKNGEGSTFVLKIPKEI